MEKLFALMGVENESAAVKFFNKQKVDLSAAEGELEVFKGLNTDLQTENKTVKAENETLKTEIAAFKETEIQNLVDSAIADKKILPGQKEWATAYAKSDRDGFDLYMTNAKALDLKKEEIEPGASAQSTQTADAEKYKVLMNDSAAFKALRNDNPDEFTKLKDAWIQTQ